MLSVTTAATETAIGSNIIVVEVFVIHIDRTAATTIKPKISFAPSVPVRDRIAKAMRLCKFQRSTAKANIKAPKNR